MPFPDHFDTRGNKIGKAHDRFLKDINQTTARLKSVRKEFEREVRSKFAKQTCLSSHNAVQNIMNKPKGAFALAIFYTL